MLKLDGMKLVTKYHELVFRFVIKEYLKVTLFNIFAYSHNDVLEALLEGFQPTNTVGHG